MVAWTEEQLEEYEKKRGKGNKSVALQGNSSVAEPQGKTLMEVFTGFTPNASSAETVNKTEAQFRSHLGHLYPGSIILAQKIKLRMADKTWYRPDFVVLTTGGAIAIYEVKGFMRDDAAVKVKVCAEMYSWANWFLVTKKRKRDGGGWDIRRVQ